MVAATQSPPVAAGRSRAATVRPDRRQAILLAAEKLFALRGYHGVSIRDIAAEAAVPLALVGYYFGAKHELYRAIFESWRGTITERGALLRGLIEERAAAAPGASDLLERILDAFVSPVVALHGAPEGRYYALMSARDFVLPSAEADAVQREFFDPMAHAFIDALMLAFPHASRGEVAWCYQFMLGALTHFLTDLRVERLSNGENQPADPAAKASLLRFVAAGFRATLTPKAPPERRAARSPPGLTRPVRPLSPVSPTRSTRRPKP